MSTWIKQENDPDDVDLETIAANRNTIKVNDVEDGEGSGDDKKAIQAINTNNGVAARALHTEGQVEFVAGLTGNPEITTAKVYNPSTHNGALALAVPGQGAIAVNLANNLREADKLALRVKGNTHLESYTAPDAAHKTLEVVNGNANPDARALKVEGKSEFAGEIIVGDGENAGEIDSMGEEDLKIGTGAGTDNVVIGRVNQVTTIQSKLRIGVFPEAWAFIDSHDDAINLNIGSDSSFTKDVVLSRTGQTTKVQGALDVDQNANFNGRADVLGAMNISGAIQVEQLSFFTDGLEVSGTLNCNGDVYCDGDLHVGENNDGLIDANDPANLDLKIGSARTRNVILSRPGQTTHVQGALDVDQNANFDGTLQVDGNTTLNGDVSVNENILYLDSAALFWQVYNPAGQNPGHPSLDFIINGNVVFYIDDEGSHDVP